MAQVLRAVAVLMPLLQQQLSQFLPLLLVLLMSGLRYGLDFGLKPSAYAALTCAAAVRHLSQHPQQRGCQVLHAGSKLRMECVY